ncbi:hypothetical protein HK096_008031 [Nowakowskiella sp. JEL0078]|nr:hypothetical protein HK096_008031 [Nowakowskiella sp. JEL0078]
MPASPEQREDILIDETDNILGSEISLHPPTENPTHPAESPYKRTRSETVVVKDLPPTTENIPTTQTTTSDNPITNNKIIYDNQITKPFTQKVTKSGHISNPPIRFSTLTVASKQHSIPAPTDYVLEPQLVNEECEKLALLSHGLLPDEIDPPNRNSAMRGRFKAQWLEAEKEELENHRKNSTWTRTKLSTPQLKNTNIVGSRWRDSRLGWLLRDSPSAMDLTTKKHTPL